MNSSKGNHSSQDTFLLKGILFLILFQASCSSNHGINQNKENPLLHERVQLISTTLQQDYPVVRLKNSNNQYSERIQDIFIRSPRLQEFYIDKRSKGKMLNEIFSISRIRPQDVNQGLQGCKVEHCFRVEMYNYALNVSFIGVVDVENSNLVELNMYAETQPDVPPHLIDLALEIARNDTSIIHAYGENYQNQKPLMPGTKTALNRTKCQRSRHLCVAPTFIKGERALWVIVDLTDLNIAGFRWTQVGETGMAISERTLQNKKIMECYCDTENKLVKEEWTLSYSMSRSDGLVVRNITYKNREIFSSVKLVDWHVSYSKTDGFGYSDAVGCPEFSTAAVLAVEPPYVEPIIESGDTTGFLLGQKYYSEGWPTPCNYNYHQYFEFYKDGRFRPVAGSIGRGCGNNGVYRPVTRIAVAGKGNNFFEWKEGTWKKWTNEQWTLQSEHTDYFEDHIWMRTETPQKNGVYLISNTGQLRDGGRGDQAFVYVTRFNKTKAEGESDLPTIGPCCNTDYQQGPEKFIDPVPESIEDSELVIWYVPQLFNDDTKGKEYCWAESLLKNGVYNPVIYPCYSGPMFKLY